MNISRFLLKLRGWRIDQRVATLPHTCVICVAPHTSNWDFIWGKLAYNALSRRASFIIKKEWLRPPFGWLFRPMGAVGVDRSHHTSLTDQMAEAFSNRSISQLAITPEATRSLNPEWKKGFYYIARKANVPILLAGLDYSTRTIVFGEVIKPSDDERADLRRIRDFYAQSASWGCHPEQFTLPDWDV